MRNNRYQCEWDPQNAMIDHSALDGNWNNVNMVLIPRKLMVVHKVVMTTDWMVCCLCGHLHAVKMAENQRIGFFIKIQNWQYWHYCQLSIPIYFAVSFFIALHGISRCEIKYQWVLDFNTADSIVWFIANETSNACGEEGTTLDLPHIMVLPPPLNHGSIALPVPWTEPMDPTPDPDFDPSLPQNSHVDSIGIFFLESLWTLSCYKRTSFDKKKLCIWWPEQFPVTSGCNTQRFGSLDICTTYCDG